MPARLDDPVLDQVFRSARTRNGWREDPLPESILREIYDLAKFGPTAANSTPARFVFVTSQEAKDKLASVAAGANPAKIRQASIFRCIIRGDRGHTLDVLGSDVLRVTDHRSWRWNLSVHRRCRKSDQEY